MTKPFMDPIAQLMQEHDETLRQLKKLHRASVVFLERGFSDSEFDHIQASLKFINEEVNHHNHKEEQALFPILERYVAGPTGVMRKDHKELFRYFVKLRSAVTQVGKNRKNPRAAKTLGETGKALVQIFVNHIHKENYVLFPLVQRFLSKEELREVARKMI